MNKKFLALIAGIAMLAPFQQAFSAGFFLIEQSVSSMGTAYAGAGAIAEDASTIFFNPAGLTRLCGFQSVSGLHLIVPVLDYDDEGSRAVTSFAGPGGIGFIPPDTTFPPATFQDLEGNDGRDAGETAGVSHSYYAWRLNECWAVGLGINAPFGLITNYNHGWKGRYHALRSSLLSININPCVAYKFNRCWSVGAGFDVMYIHAKLSNKVDFGLIGVQNLGTVLAGILGLVPQESDGYVKVKGNSWGYGGNIGVLYEPCCGTRIGVHYRSEIKHNLEGKEKFEDIPLGILLTPLSAVFQDTRVKADITFPSLLSISAYHEFNRCFAIVGDITWTKWDVLHRLRLRFNNEFQPDAITTLKWQNVFRYSFGAIYRPNCCWTYRLGAAYDETPVRCKHLRSPRIPDKDRIWVATGVGYDWNRCIHFDVGYAHLFVPTARIDKFDFDLPEDILRGGLRGKYDAYTDIISGQMVWTF